MLERQKAKKMKKSHLEAMSAKDRELMEKHSAMFEHLWHPPECGEGWYDLLDELMTDLEREMAKTEASIKVRQIKEKFGGLRFYADTSSSFKQAFSLNDLIIAAEDKSFSICEICGQEGELRRKNGWLRTLCVSHWREWSEKNE